MGMTWFEQGLERGLEQGLEQGLQRGLQQGQVEGLRKAALQILEARFGDLNQAVRERVKYWPADKLEELISRAVLV